MLSEMLPSIPSSNSIGFLLFFLDSSGTEDSAFFLSEPEAAAGMADGVANDDDDDDFVAFFFSFSIFSFSVILKTEFSR